MKRHPRISLIIIGSLILISGLIYLIFDSIFILNSVDWKSFLEFMGRGEPKYLRIGIEFFWEISTMVVGASAILAGIANHGGYWSHFFVSVLFAFLIFDVVNKIRDNQFSNPQIYLSLFQIIHSFILYILYLYSFNIILNRDKKGAKYAIKGN